MTDHITDVEILAAGRWNPDKTYVPGTTHDQKCTVCGRLVALAPSSRTFLTATPDMRIVCVPCLAAVTGGTQ